MPPEERVKHGIGQGYESHDGTRDAAYRAFEQYMFNQVQEREQSVVLAVIGRGHIPGLAQLFPASGYEVYQYDVYSREWFRGIPQETADGLVGYYKP